MIDKINTWLIRRYLSVRNELSVFEKEKVEYALSILLNEIEKVIGVLSVFIFTGKVKMFLLSFVVLMSLRIFIGGLHFNKRYQCFLFTLLFFLVTVLLSEVFIIDKAMGCLVFCFSLINIVLCAPLPSRHRVLVSEGGKKRLRNMTILILSMWMICYIFLNGISANIILWTIIVQQLEILYYKFIYGRKLKYEQ